MIAAEPSALSVSLMCCLQCTTVWPKLREEVWLPQDKLFEDLNHEIPVTDELDLSHWRIGDDDMLTVNEANHEVAILKLAKCMEITDAGIFNLVKFHRVKILDLRGCHRLTDRALDHIRHEFPRLEHLDLGSVCLFVGLSFSLSLSCSPGYAYLFCMSGWLPIVMSISAKTNPNSPSALEVTA